MTMFSSTPLLNDDPEPWEHPRLLLRYSQPGLGAVFAPRPEFTRGKHNPVNSVLIAFRKLVPGEREQFRKELDTLWAELESGALSMTVHLVHSVSEIRHARRVIGRLLP